MSTKDKLEILLKQIESEAEYTAGFTGREKFSPRVMQAMKEVPREKFVAEHYLAFAYDNVPLSIGYGQTISQPYIVALMTDMLDLTEDSTVLEIGTGSGYQAAILGKLCKQVYSIEKIPELAESAQQRLKTLGFDNIETRCSNGYNGWHEKAPFDAIIVTAAASHIPPALTEQLKPGGRMVIPVGLPYMHQELMLVTKDQQGNSETTSLLDVAFVPLVMDEDTKNSEQKKT
jgi:protein-L-isoaspartate(D-aspartate) O-methyltransferase